MLNLLERIARCANREFAGLGALARRAVLVAGLSALGAGSALASPGCDAVNAGGLNYHIDFATAATSRNVNGAFLAGDQITLSVTGVLNLNVGGVLRLTLGSASVTAPGTDVSGVTLTLTANGAETAAGWQLGAGVTDGPADITVVCVAAPTTTNMTIKSSLNPSQFGQSVTFTATVTSPGGTPTGLVTFFDGATVLGTGTLSGGIATFATSPERRHTSDFGGLWRRRWLSGEQLTGAGPGGQQ